MNEKKNACLLDCATTHTILTGKYYFSNLTMHKANVHTISSPAEIIDGSRNTTIILPNGTTLHIEDALLITRSKRNILSFKDVRCNGYQLETIYENNNDYLYITSYKMGIRTIHEKLKASNSRLYCVPIRAIESYATMSWRLVKPNKFGLWYDHISHPKTTMMRRIISNSRGHFLKI